MVPVYDAVLSLKRDTIISIVLINNNIYVMNKSAMYCMDKSIVVYKHEHAYMLFHLLHNIPLRFRYTKREGKNVSDSSSNSNNNSNNQNTFGLFFECVSSKSCIAMTELWIFLVLYALVAIL